MFPKVAKALASHMQVAGKEKPTHSLGLPLHVNLLQQAAVAFTTIGQHFVTLMCCPAFRTALFQLGTRASQSSFHRTYKGPTTLGLVQHLIAHNHTVCARLLPPQRASGTSDGSSSTLGVVPRPGPSLVSAGAAAGQEQQRQPPKGPPRPIAAAFGLGAVPVQAAAWVLQCMDGSVGMGYTRAGYRKLGLMSHCVLALALLLLSDQGGDAQANLLQCDGPARGSALPPLVYAYVVQNNAASLSMMRALGAQNAGEVVWAGYELEEAPAPLSLGEANAPYCRL
jgi:hypothetical protein